MLALNYKMLFIFIKDTSIPDMHVFITYIMFRLLQLHVHVLDKFGL